MDIREIIKVGEVFENEFVVLESDTADSSGNEGVKVLSTPALLKYVENGSSSGLFKRLPKGYSPLGIQVNLKHIAATPVEGKIKVVSKVVNVEHNRTAYEFEVFYEKKLISKGRYEQAIVLLDDFLEKNKAL